ncbi:hypothetical protein SLEP1_g47938 [Rubroshorea leprosula]|uniref:Uncharacterized protein n=1 Tax=Rubroshorea leprosula TaxID=152421 RepID=A0AAV5LUD4_9ROSI|nr:hypothetical protein SLEP1_g47938 [Rubroshorea leprosula]
MDLVLLRRDLSCNLRSRPLAFFSLLPDSDGSTASWVGSEFLRENPHRSGRGKRRKKKGEKEREREEGKDRRREEDEEGWERGRGRMRDKNGGRSKNRTVPAGTTGTYRFLKLTEML